MTEDKLKEGLRLTNLIGKLNSEIGRWESAMNSTSIEAKIKSSEYPVFAFAFDKFNNEAWKEFCCVNIRNINDEIEMVRKEFETL